MDFINKIRNAISRGDDRTQLMIKNIIGSFAVKGWSLLVQLLLVPLALNCLTAYEYGLWLTLNAIMTWMDNFDVGLGNGLRNRLAEAVATGDMLTARKYVSTTITSLAVLATVFCVILLVGTPLVNLYGFLNVEQSLVPNLNLIVVMLSVTVCMSFVAKSVGSVFLALQMPFLNNLMAACASTMTLIFIWLLTLNGIHSLMLACLAFTLMPLLSYIGFSIYAFYFKYAHLRPSLSFFDFSSVRSLMGLGVKFFIGQLSGMMLMLTANLIISKALTPAEVTPYQIAYRYFSIILIPFTLISTPTWSATTDAYKRGDIAWVKKTLRQQEWIVTGIGVVLIGMLLASSLFYSIWVGDKVSISFSLSASVATYTFILVASMCYSNILYGIGKMDLTVLTVFLMAIIFVAGAYSTTQSYGVVGMVILQSAVTLGCTLQNMIQCKLILAGKAHGFLNR